MLLERVGSLQRGRSLSPLIAHFLCGRTAAILHLGHCRTCFIVLPVLDLSASSFYPRAACPPHCSDIAHSLTPALLGGHAPAPQGDTRSVWRLRAWGKGAPGVWWVGPGVPLALPVPPVAPQRTTRPVSAGPRLLAGTGACWVGARGQVKEQKGRGSPHHGVLKNPLLSKEMLVSSPNRLVSSVRCPGLSRAIYWQRA